MSDIAEYERRISFALERIGRGVEALSRKAGEPPPPPAEPAPAEPAPAVTVPAPDTTNAADPAELAALREALDAERAANAQLSERVRAIREKQDTTLAAMERKLGAAVRAQEASLREAAALRRANDDLVAANRKLMDEGVRFSDEALMAELHALRAARGSEAAELEQIIAGLAPLVNTEEAGNA